MDTSLEAMYAGSVGSQMCLKNSAGGKEPHVIKVQQI